jgi:hypothetical protein
VLVLATLTVAVGVAVVVRSTAGDDEPQGVGTPAERQTASAAIDAAPTPTSTAVSQATGMPSRTPAEADGSDDPGEADGSDDALIAEAFGWTPEELVRYRQAEQAMDEIIHRLVTERPNVYVGAVLSEHAGGAPSLYIKGPADAFIRELLDAAAIEIRLVDGQPYSHLELEEREARLHESLVAHGFRSLRILTDIENGRIDATVYVRPSTEIRPADVLARMPADLQVGVTVQVVVDPAFWDAYVPRIILAGGG